MQTWSAGRKGGVISLKKSPIGFGINSQGFDDCM